jgi:hypothetical protein
MKTRYIFTDSSLETIYNSFVIENETILKTNINDLDEINKDKSIGKNIIFFNAEALNSCSLDEYDKSDKAELLKAKFFSGHDDQLLLNPSDLTFFSSFEDNIGIWGDSNYLDTLKQKTLDLRKSIFLPDYLLFFERKNIVVNLGSHYCFRLKDGRGYSGHYQKINALLKSNSKILDGLETRDVATEELVFLQNLNHTSDELDLISLVKKYHLHHLSSLNLLKSPFNIGRLLSLDLISLPDFKKFASLIFATFLVSLLINATLKSQYEAVTKETKQIFLNLGNNSSRLVNPKVQIDQLVNGLKISDNQNYLDSRILNFLDNYQITELKRIEINIDDKFSVLYLESLSSQKLNIIMSFLSSSNLIVEENFTEVNNQFNGSIKVLFNE